MRRKLFEVLTLTVVWAVLWGDLDLATAVSGLAVCLLILWQVRPSTFRRVGQLHPGRTVRFVFSTLGRLVIANAQVAWEALKGGRTIHEAIVEVEVGEVSEELATMIVTSVSLRPGTVVVGIRPGYMYVHVLHGSDLEEARRQLRQEAEEVKALVVGERS